MSVSVKVWTSSIHWKWLFATRNFRKWEIVLPWDISKTVSRSEFEQMSEFEKVYISCMDGKYICMQEPERYMNHSCTPNTEVIDFCDVANRDILFWEELTSDYTTGIPVWESMLCKCGSKICKKNIHL